MKNRGQTLIEAVIALSALMIVLTAISIIEINSLSNAKYLSDQNRAAKFAQEGLEYLRNLQTSDANTFNTYSNLSNPSSTNNSDICFPEGSDGKPELPSVNAQGNPTDPNFWATNVNGVYRCPVNINKSYVRQFNIQQNTVGCTGTSNGSSSSGSGGGNGNQPKNPNPGGGNSTTWSISQTGQSGSYSSSSGGSCVIDSQGNATVTCSATSTQATVNWSDPFYLGTGTFGSCSWPSRVPNGSCSTPNNGQRVSGTITDATSTNCIFTNPFEPPVCTYSSTTFHVDPPTVTTIAPAAFTTDTYDGSTLTLAWNAVQSTSSYKINVGSTPNGDSAYASKTVGGTNTTIPLSGITTPFYIRLYSNINGIPNTYYTQYQVTSITVSGGGGSGSGGGSGGSGSSSQVSASQVSVTVYWTSSKCPSSGNTYCHSTTLTACLNNDSSSTQL